MNKEILKIYFCGSIRGGHSDQELYLEIISHLQEFGTVLTEHIGDKNLQADQRLSDTEIFQRDVEWLDSADVIIAEVSTPSLGVGYEISRAVSLNKRILCLSQADKNIQLSAMITGCPDLKIAVYSGIDEAKSAINNFLDE